MATISQEHLRKKNPGILLKTPMLIVVFLILFGCSNPEMELGEQVFKGTCKACHAGGLNGAPIYGNKRMWAKRLPQGIPVLVEHASSGYGLMPAKGGNTNLTEQEITAAVKFMVSKVAE